MCGDGANDLLALKEADLSLGIQESDASYASSFTIRTLLDVDAVIRESKGNVSNIMQLFIYITSTYMASEMFAITLAANAADMSSNGRFYYNFTSLLLFPILIPLSRPSPHPTKYVPVANFLRLYGQLMIYGNFIIMYSCMLLSYIYFKSTSDFSPTTRTELTFEDPVTTNGTDSAAMFVVVNPVWTWASLAMYWGKPFKECFCQNVLLIVFFVLNVIASTFLFFSTSIIATAFDFMAIQMMTAGIMFAITGGGLILQQAFNLIVHCTDLDKTTLD